MGCNSSIPISNALKNEMIKNARIKYNKDSFLSKNSRYTLANNINNISDKNLDVLDKKYYSNNSSITTLS